VATQEQLYAGLDLDLSWSERDLPERVRTKHVHRLHPYLGKYIPQLVEELFRRHVPPRGRVLDPFAGSGTTLVQALESGLDSTGVDIASFNCLLTSVKSREHNPFVLEQDLRAAHARVGETNGERPSAYVRRWFAPQAARERRLATITFPCNKNHVRAFATRRAERFGRPFPDKCESLTAPFFGGGFDHARMHDRRSNHRDLPKGARQRANHKD